MYVLVVLFFIVLCFGFIIVFNVVVSGFVNVVYGYDEEIVVIGVLVEMLFCYV